MDMDMDRKERFFAALRDGMTVVLATAGDGRVNMREVSPVPYEGGILIFTSTASVKYSQLRENPRCCIAAAGFFAECDAAFRGGCMLPENAPLREAYCRKFPGAFDEGVENGGREDDFLFFRPTRLYGWDFPDGRGTADAYPTIPFSTDL